MRRRAVGYTCLTIVYPAIASRACSRFARRTRRPMMTPSSTSQSTASVTDGRTRSSCAPMRPEATWRQRRIARKSDIRGCGPIVHPDAEDLLRMRHERGKRRVAKRTDPVVSRSATVSLCDAGFIEVNRHRHPEPSTAAAGLLQCARGAVPSVVRTVASLISALTRTGECTGVSLNTTPQGPSPQGDAETLPPSAASGAASNQRQAAARSLSPVPSTYRSQA